MWNFLGWAHYNGKNVSCISFAFYFVIILLIFVIGYGYAKSPVTSWLWYTDLPLWSVSIMILIEKLQCAKFICYYVVPVTHNLREFRTAVRGLHKCAKCHSGAALPRRAGRKSEKKLCKCSWTSPGKQCKVAGKSLRWLCLHVFAVSRNFVKAHYWNRWNRSIFFFPNLTYSLRLSCRWLLWLFSSNIFFQCSCHYLQPFEYCQNSYFCAILDSFLLWRVLTTSSDHRSRWVSTKAAFFNVMRAGRMMEFVIVKQTRLNITRIQIFCFAVYPYISNITFVRIPMQLISTILGDCHILTKVPEQGRLWPDAGHSEPIPTRLSGACIHVPVCRDVQMNALKRLCSVWRKLCDSIV